MKALTLALALSTALVVPALAQNDTTQQQPMTTQQQTTAPAASSTAGGGQFITQAQQGEIRGSKLVGVNIYNNNDENVGEVNDLILDKSGNIKAIVIGVGGFLGIGEKNVALPFDAIQWVDTPRASVAATNPPAAGTGMGAGTPANDTAATGAAGTATGMANNAGNAAGTAATDATGAVAGANPVANRDYPDHGMINMSKDQLNNAPKFQYLSEAR